MCPHTLFSAAGEEGQSYTRLLCYAIIADGVFLLFCTSLSLALYSILFPFPFIMFCCTVQIIIIIGTI